LPFVVAVAVAMATLLVPFVACIVHPFCWPKKDTQTYYCNFPVAPPTRAVQE